MNTKRVLLVLLAVVGLGACAGKQEKSIEIQGDEDLAGLRVATIAGSCYDMDLSARKDINLQLFNTDAGVLQALINDKADVAVHDEVVYNAIVRKENKVKIAHVGEQSFPTALMFSKGAADLAQTQSDVQHRMEQDGSMERLKDFWLTDQYAQAETFTHLPAETSGTPIRVAACTTSAPISFQVDGEWYGIEIDLLRELGKELHRPLEIKLYDAASGMLAVKTGLADVLCGCIFVTPERQEQFQFADPYHSYHPAYFVMDREAEQSDQGFLAQLKNGIRKNLITENRWKYITNGLWETVKISLLAILLGSVLGVGLYCMSRGRKKWMRSFAKGYSWFVGGIPELVLLLILFYVVFAKTGVPPDIVAVITSLEFSPMVTRLIYSNVSDILKVSGSL